MPQKRYCSPTRHWNNFTLPELREILEHCAALERIGIAQDEKMMASIQTDIDLLEKEQARLQTPKMGIISIEMKPAAR